MRTILLDANAVIMQGRGFSDFVRTESDRGKRVILPQSVKLELVDDVLENEEAPKNHRRSARTIQRLLENECLTVRSPDFDQYGDVVDETRRRIADDSLPEHAVKADQYIPALVCQVADREPVILVTADTKLREIVADITDRRDLTDVVTLTDPASIR